MIEWGESGDFAGSDVLDVGNGVFNRLTAAMMPTGINALATTMPDYGINSVFDGVTAAAMMPPGSTPSISMPDYGISSLFNGLTTAFPPGSTRWPARCRSTTSVRPSTD